MIRVETVVKMERVVTVFLAIINVGEENVIFTLVVLLVHLGVISMLNVFIVVVVDKEKNNSTNTFVLSSHLSI